MEDRDVSISHQKIQKVNDSMLAFKHLIQSLRVKNQNLRPTSEANPESDNSSVSRLYASQKIDNDSNARPQSIPIIQANIPINANSTPIITSQNQIITTTTQLNTAPAPIRTATTILTTPIQTPTPPTSTAYNQNFPTLTTNSFIRPMFQDNMSSVSVSAVHAHAPQDDGIKLKARGNVAGRDILCKKPSLLHHSKFTETVMLNKQQARNKNIQLNTSSKKQQDSQLPSIQHLKQLMIKHTNIQQPTPKKDQPIQQQQYWQSARTSLKKTMTTMPLNKPKFQQNKLNVNVKAAARNKIKDIDEKVVLKYCRENKGLRPGSQATQIFQYFQGLMREADVVIVSPFIKKFKNCVYFGAQTSEHDICEGFLYFYEKKIYYGEFMNTQKHGKGVEVAIDDQTIYKGIFKQGQKTGKFWVKKHNQSYIGMLEKGEYHGQGKLETKQSIYEGQFENGEKHGFGDEFFPKTGAKIVGYFDHGVFSKRSKSSFSHSEIEKATKYKVPIKPEKQRLSRKRKSTNSRMASDEAEGTLAGFTHEQNYQNEQEMIYNPPFASTNRLSFRKTPFNKQKIETFLPGMTSNLGDPMPQNCRDFDYSFDVSSRKDTDQFSQFGQFSYGKHRGQGGGRERKGMVLPFGQIEEERGHLNTSAFEDPLPMPCFYKR